MGLYRPRGGGTVDTARHAWTPRREGCGKKAGMQVPRMIGLERLTLREVYCKKIERGDHEQEGIFQPFAVSCSVT